LGLLGFVEPVEELQLGLVAGAHRLDQGFVARVGEGDNVAPAVLFVGATFDQALRFEAIEQGDHRRAVDLDSGGRLLLIVSSPDDQ
jgi:hypothetical protein